MTGAPDLVAIGEVLLDFVAPSADLTVASEFVATPGGAPANVAVAASKMGANAAFVGAVGDDAFGSYLRQHLQDNGVDTSGMVSMRERTTLAFVAAAPAEIPDYLFYRGADAALTSDQLPLDLIASSASLYAGSMALLGEPSRSATTTAVMHARAAGVLVAVDPNFRPTSWPSLTLARRTIRSLLEHADVVKLNEQEALLLSGVPKLDAAMNALSDARRLLVVTRGPAGCLWRWRGSGGEIAAPEVAFVDSIGAGDAFTGALLVALLRLGYSGGRFWMLRRDELESALQFACAAGALAGTRVGAMSALPTRDEVDALLATTGTAPGLLDSARRRDGADPD